MQTGNVEDGYQFEISVSSPLFEWAVQNPLENLSFIQTCDLWGW